MLRDKKKLLLPFISIALGGGSNFRKSCVTKFIRIHTHATLSIMLKRAIKYFERVFEVLGDTHTQILFEFSETHNLRL